MVWARFVPGLRICSRGRPIARLEFFPVPIFCADITYFMGFRLGTLMWLSMATTRTPNVYFIICTTSCNTILKIC